MNLKVNIAVIGTDHATPIAETLRALGPVSLFNNIQNWKDEAESTSPDLVVLESTSVEIEVPMLRSVGSQRGWTFSVIAICSADSRCETLRAVLEKGADDIFVTPVPGALLRAKAEHLVNLQARANDAEPETFDPERIEDLTMKEYRILRAIMAEPRMTISRRSLMKKVWPDLLISPKTVDVHLFNLRRKIRRYGYDIRSRLEGGTEDGRCFELSRVDRGSAKPALKSDI